MVLVTVENLSDHASEDVEVSRVPCVGEYLSKDGDDSYRVHSVIHCMNVNPDNDPVSIVRVVAA